MNKVIEDQFDKYYDVFINTLIQINYNLLFDNKIEYSTLPKEYEVLSKFLRNNALFFNIVKLHTFFVKKKKKLDYDYYNVYDFIDFLLEKKEQLFHTEQRLTIKKIQLMPSINVDYQNVSISVYLNGFKNFLETKEEKKVINLIKELRDKTLAHHDINCFEILDKKIDINRLHDLVINLNNLLYVINEFKINKAKTYHFYNLEKDFDIMLERLESIKKA